MLREGQNTELRSGGGGERLNTNLEGMEDCLDIVLNCVDYAVHIVNCQGITSYYNQTAAEMEGLHDSDVIGKHVLQAYPSLTLETSSLMAVLASGKPILNQQQTIVSRTGKIVTILFSTFPLYRDGNLIGACDLSRDITKIKELSEKVMDLQAELLDTKKNSGRKGKEPEISSFAKYSFADIIGRHESIVRLKVLGQRVAATSSPVLVIGETGCGKELVVQSIHNESGRRRHPFVAQNCAAFPASLLESILFGTVKGSFTGAEDRPGLFELAEGGTLFLDEINSMPMELQSKLLRVLQDGTLRRVGDSKVRQVDVRIMACTNVEPEEAVRKKELRLDLYYRLNVVALRVPPLRERKSDIMALVDFFIDQYNRKLQRKVNSVSEEVAGIFLKHSWPGNVRELQHGLEHAMNVTSGSIIEAEHLPEHLRKSGLNKAAEMNLDLAGKSLPDYLRAVEKDSIMIALEKCGGNVSKTALHLGIPRQTIQYKLKVYGLNEKNLKTPYNGGIYDGETGAGR
jgi:arginine utilization regulatory protein